MWTDALVAALIWANNHVLSLLLLALAGLCFVFAGTVGIMVFRRRDVTLGPVPRKLAAPPATALPRVDSDTGVVPRIPGATPAQLVAVARMLDHVDQAAEETARILPQFPPLDLGPVCNVCGGPFGACTCGIKPVLRALPGPSVEELEALARQACPLTADEIPTVVLDTRTPIYDAAKRGDTVELSAKVAKILEGSK